MTKNKEKTKQWIIVGLVAVIVLLSLLLIDKSLIKNSGNPLQANVLNEIKQEAKCPCGCDLTFEDCEKYDPNCPIRPEIMAEVNEMINNGESKEEILAIFDQASAPTPTSNVSADDDPVKGRKDAPVTIIEFSDFECPYCASFYSQTLLQIEEEYIRTGKAKLVYRDFPLSFHQNAQKAAEAAECADEQDKFWEYHDLLFERQSEWSNIGISKFKQYAGEIGLNTSEFNKCLDSGKMASEVKKDFQDGQSYGVSGTPAFFVNGEMLVGAQPIGVFRQVIDKYLE